MKEMRSRPISANIAEVNPHQFLHYVLALVQRILMDTIMRLMKEAKKPSIYVRIVVVNLLQYQPYVQDLVPKM